MHHVFVFLSQRYISQLTPVTNSLTLEPVLYVRRTDCRQPRGGKEGKGAPVRGYEDLLAAAMQAQPVFEALLRGIVSAHPEHGNP